MVKAAEAPFGDEEEPPDQGGRVHDLLVALASVGPETTRVGWWFSRCFQCSFGKSWQATIRSQSRGKVGELVIPTPLLGRSQGKTSATAAQVAVGNLHSWPAQVPQDARSPRNAATITSSAPLSFLGPALT